MKALFKIAAVFIFAMIIWTPRADAQVSPSKSVDQGVLNGRAVKLPKPEYPQAARDAGIEGVVAVNIEIDEQGNVVLAEADFYDQRMHKAEDGTMLEKLAVDLILRQAAEQAARQASFSPTLLVGVPVRVKGRIFYNFVAKSNEIPTSTGEVKSAGVMLNGKASSLPPPQYPAAAKAVRAAGAVTVAVVVDENGDVLSAKAVSGHPLLRATSERAAMGAKFAPTAVNGEYVKVSGVLTYNFIP